MKKMYFVDFENVHNAGINNIEDLNKNDLAFIFTTKNAGKIKENIDCFNNVKKITVPKGKESLDKHLLFLLANIMGKNEDGYEYIVISNDKGYDDIIESCNKAGFKVSRKPSIEKFNLPISKNPISKNQLSDQMDIYEKKYRFSGKDRAELNIFLQRSLSGKYKSVDVNRICGRVVAHCNDDRYLLRIHNELQNMYDKYLEIYIDVKKLLKSFSNNK